MQNLVSPLELTIEAARGDSAVTSSVPIESYSLVVHRLPESVVHLGTECAHCHKKPITGMRYKCVQCDCDLCQDCIVLPQVHTEGHRFLPLSAPVDGKCFVDSADKVLHYSDYKKYISECVDKSIPIVKVVETGVVSFTPYISNRCSASCRFCSEKLSLGGMAAAGLSVCSEYRDKLIDAFVYQRDRCMFLSISGMEPTESVDQLSLVNEAVQIAEQQGCVFSERVMYSNLSGFTKKWERLSRLVQDMKLTRIECSRHHFDDSVNQGIARFKSGETIRSNEVFTSIVKKLLTIVPVTMVCVMQKSGIATPESIISYLKFARSAGVTNVVFRGLSVFTEKADGVAIASYIAENRVNTLDVIRQLPSDVFQLYSVKEGYYYFSFCYHYCDMNVLFEMSDYDQMKLSHYSDQQYKLIFYPNGDLCKDWNMQARISEEVYRSVHRPPKSCSEENTSAFYRDMALVAKELTSDGNAGVIGSYCSWLTTPQVLDHKPHDLDLLIKNDMDTIRRAIVILKKQGFEVFSWQDKIDDTVSYDLLKGRYYIRGIRGELMVDLTYELKGVQYESLRDHYITVNGIGTFDKQGQTRILEVSAAERPDLKQRLDKLRSI